MTTNTDKMAALAEARHIATGADLEWQAKIFHEEMDKLGVPRDDGEDFYSLIGRANLALEAAGRVQQAEPVGFMSEQQIALIKDPGIEGGVYIPMRKTSAGLLTLALYTAAPAERAPAPTVAEPVGMLAQGVVWGKLPADVQKALSDLSERTSKPVQAEAPPYGLCPLCGAAGVMRERRPGGNDKCSNGHVYPSSRATQPPAIPAAPAVQASGEREAFEEWAVEQPRVTQHEDCFATMPHGERRYTWGDVQSLWLAWQARAALASPPASGEKQ